MKIQSFAYFLYFLIHRGQSASPRTFETQKSNYGQNFKELNVGWTNISFSINRYPWMTKSSMFITKIIQIPKY